jgi:3-phytase
MMVPGMRMRYLGLLIAILSNLPAIRAEDSRSSVRFATFNTSLFRNNAGELTAELEEGKSDQARKIAAIVQRCRPDILLVNELDYAADGKNAQLLNEKYFAAEQEGSQALHYPYVYSAPVNTGVPSDMDLDGDGKVAGPADCFGYGTHPGQYGLAVYSQFPIQTDAIRTFQKFLWKDLPNAAIPTKKKDEPYYPANAWDRFRLSSKSHWDVPIDVKGKSIHFLVSHPTPPVFDGPEDRNGRRNHDEIRFFADYVDPQRSTYHRDDLGKTGGLPAGSHFVVAGDLNADPVDGQSYDRAVLLLLNHPLIASEPAPKSDGGVEAARITGGANARHQGDPSTDTGDFADTEVGNLRCDYCLPSRSLQVRAAGVFWPLTSEPEAGWITASDHRLVWIDVQASDLP